MFKKANKTDWIAKANQDLKGKILAENLKYEVGNEICISPFLTHDDIATGLMIQGPKTKAGVRIIAEDEVSANQKSKLLLNFAAEVLAFHVNSDTDFEQLFDGIFLDMITVTLITDQITKVNDSITRYLHSRYTTAKPDIIVVDQNNLLVLNENRSFENRIQSAKVWLESKPHSSIIVVELKNDFLAQVSELRAIRAFADSQEVNVFIMAVLSKNALVDKEIHPLIITNYLLLSAYLGMCDVAFGVDGGDDLELARLSLNIHNVFKEECGFNFVNDPMAGAYIVEKITQELLKSASA